VGSERVQNQIQLWGMRSLFVRLGIKKKVPRPKAVKACAEAQKEWKKRGLASALREYGITAEKKVVWADEMRIGLQRQVRKVWAPRGVKVEQKL